MFVVAVMGELASLMLDRPVPDRFAWKTRASIIKVDRSAMTTRWKISVDSLLPLIVSNAGDDVYGAVRSATIIPSIAKKLALQVQSLKQQYAAVMSPVRDSTELG
jgi:hypothetical protein